MKIRGWILIISFLSIIFLLNSCKNTEEPSLLISIKIIELYDYNADSTYDKALLSVSVINPSGKDITLEKYVSECFDKDGNLIFKQTILDPYPYKLGGLEKYIWNNIFINLTYDGKKVKKYKFTLYYLDNNKNYSTYAEKTLN